MGNVSEVFINISFGIVARFCCPNYLGRISLGKMGQGNPYQRVRETKRKILGNDPKGNVNEDLGYISPNFPPIDNGQRSHTLQLSLRDWVL